MHVNGLDTLSHNAANAIWDALVSDPGTGVCVIDTEGRVFYANDMAHLFVGASGNDAVGKTLDELLPVEHAREHLEYIRKAAQGEKPLLVKSIWKGRRLRSAIHPAPTEGAAPAKMLVISRLIASDEDFKRIDGEFDVVESKVADLGELGTLTPREVEVLTLLGQGLSIKQIAGVLNRSPKTIENHRHSLGIKLQTTNRVQLARIAYEAGLTSMPPTEGDGAASQLTT